MTSTELQLQLQPKPTRTQQRAVPTLSQTLRDLKDAIRQKHDSMLSVGCIYRGLGRFEVIGKPGMRAHLQNPKQCSQSFSFGKVYYMDIVDARTSNHGQRLVRIEILLDPEGPLARIRSKALARG